MACVSLWEQLTGLKGHKCFCLSLKKVQADVNHLHY